MSNQPFEFQPKSKELVIDIVHIPVHSDEILFQQALERRADTAGGVEFMLFDELSA